MGLAPVGRGGDSVPLFLEERRREPPVDGVLVDDEDARRKRRPRGGRREMKRRAAIRLALEPDASAHHRDEAARDAQAEPRAAVAARRRSVGLRERLEHRLPPIGRDPDAGVADRQVVADRPRPLCWR